MGDVRAAMLRLFAAALLAVLTGQADSARADAFDDHINRGNLLYNEQNLPQAAREFEAAYRLKKQPDLLLNIGRIYLKLRRADAAQRYCALYLTEEFEATPDRKAKATDCVTQAKQMLAAKKPPSAGRPSATPTPATAQATPGHVPIPAAVQAAGPSAVLPAAPAAVAATVPAASPGPVGSSGQPADPAAPPAAPPPAASLVSNPLAPVTSIPAREPGPRSPSSSADATPQSVAPTAPPTLAPSSAEPQANAALRLQPSASTAGIRSTEHVPIYKRWWFWTIVGVGAAGAAAGITAGVLSSQGPAGPVYELGDVPTDNQRMVTLGP